MALAVLDQVGLEPAEIMCLLSADYCYYFIIIVIFEIALAGLELAVMFLSLPSKCRNHRPS